MSNTGPTCGSCRYYNAKRGFCQLHPPVVQDARHALFPRTFWDDWCGHWSHRDSDKPLEGPP
jgi:hypothetical protein